MQRYQQHGIQICVSMSEYAICAQNMKSDRQIYPTTFSCILIHILRRAAYFKSLIKQLKVCEIEPLPG